MMTRKKYDKHGPIEPLYDLARYREFLVEGIEAMEAELLQGDVDGMRGHWQRRSDIRDQLFRDLAESYRELAETNQKLMPFFHARLTESKVRGEHDHRHTSGDVSSTAEWVAGAIGGNSMAASEEPGED